MRVVKNVQVAREVVDASSMGNVQGHFGQGSEQPVLVDVRARCMSLD